MRRGSEAVLVVATRIPILIARLLRIGLGLLWRRNRSRATFQRVLQRQGLDRTVARRFAARYRTQVSVRALLGAAIREVR